MFSLISGSVHAAMLRLGFGLVLVGLVGVTQAAQSDEDFFEPRLNLLTTRFVHSGTDFLPPYQFNASVVFTPSSDTEPVGLGFSNTSRLHSVVKSQQEAVQAANPNWQQAYVGGRNSLRRLLSVEFNGELANVTFRPRSISIERERLKIMLQQNSASMSWSKAF